jgi:hypothetical protein
MGIEVKKIKIDINHLLIVDFYSYRILSHFINYQYI